MSQFYLWPKGLHRLCIASVTQDLLSSFSCTLLPIFFYSLGSSPSPAVSPSTDCLPGSAVLKLFSCICFSSLACQQFYCLCHCCCYPVSLSLCYSAVCMTELGKRRTLQSLTLGLMFQCQRREHSQASLTHVTK